MIANYRFSKPVYTLWEVISARRWRCRWPVSPHPCRVTSVWIEPRFLRWL